MSPAVAARPLGNNTGNVSRRLESPLTGEPKIRLHHQLREYHDLYRKFGSKRLAKCCRVRLAREVVIARRQGTHALHVKGVIRCGLVWECPTCQAQIKAERAAEVAAAVRWWTDTRGGYATMLTLTVRHAAFRGRGLQRIRAGVSQAWRNFQAGRAFASCKAWLGLAHSIRALEVTYGDTHGWHPHLHVILLTTRPLILYRAEVRRSGEWRPILATRNERQAWAVALRHGGRVRELPDPAALYAITTRWQEAVAHSLGPDYVPDEVHGASLVACDREARYLARLGLEVSAPNTKSAKSGNCTPLDLLAAFAHDGDAEALERYRAYSRAMSGARQLTWSRGLKAAAGIADRTDAEVVTENRSDDEILYTLPGCTWDAVSRIPGAVTCLLEMGELYGPEGIAAALRALLRPPRELAA